MQFLNEWKTHVCPQRIKERRFRISLFLATFWTNIFRKRKWNGPEIWDWGSERGVKKRYEGTWAYIYISRGEIMMKVGSEWLWEVRKRAQYVFSLSCFITESWGERSALSDISKHDQIRDTSLVYVLVTFCLFLFKKDKCLWIFVSLVFFFYKYIEFASIFPSVFVLLYYFTFRELLLQLYILFIAFYS